nr:DNA topoisomerase 3 [Aliivibrio fischeri]OED52231.1 DNA topoisomerase III [Aliivibrio fischeri]
MRVFIAEKPSLADAILKGLGGTPNPTQKKAGYYQHGSDRVTWCYGHMLELFDPEDYDTKYKKWSLDDLPIKATFPPKMKPIKKNQVQFNVISRLIKEADSIVHAGDPDDEGNLLVDEILTHVKNTKPVERLLIADLNDKPVKAALASMRPNSEFKHLTQSALARSIADQLFGYNLTRAYTLKAREKGFENVLNVGRVQSAVLGLINQRTLANLNHTESFYYVLNGAFSINGKSLHARLIPDADNNEVDDKKRLISELDAALIKELCDGKPSHIASVESKKERKAAPLPFNLSTLQQTCAKKWGYKATETLEIAQKLYETHKLLTYPRSDCRYLSDEHMHNANTILSAIGATDSTLNPLLNDTNMDAKHKAFNSKKITAHHAIIPTEKNGQDCTLSEKERNVYQLVAMSFIALFYPDSIRDKVNALILCGAHEFNATQTTLDKQGWEVLYKGEHNDEPNANAFDLATLQQGDEGLCDVVTIDKKKTKPLKYFTESTLLAAMSHAAKYVSCPDLRKVLEAKDKNNSAESGSIGTEATRASILAKIESNTHLVSVVSEKGYSEKVYKTTVAGQEFCALLPDEIITPNTSALWADYQASIKKGELDTKTFVGYIDSYLETQIQFVKDNGVAITAIDRIVCPTCQKGSITKRKGKNGVFHACNRYPDCKTAFQDKKGKPDFEPKPKKKEGLSNAEKFGVVSETEFCKQCAKPLARKPAKKKDTFWWGCTGFPACKVRFFDKDGKPDRDKGEL